MDIYSKYFWIVGGGILQSYMVKEVISRGYIPIITDNDDNCYCRNISDNMLFYKLDTYDVKGHVELFNKLFNDGLDIVGVSTCGADVGITVNYLNVELLNESKKSMPYHRIINNKLNIRHSLNSINKSLNPDYFFEYNKFTAGIEAIYNNLTYKLSYPEIPGNNPLFPCIFKPLSERASRGITIARNKDELSLAYDRLTDKDHFIVEKYHSGTEHSAEMIVDNKGLPVFFNIVDRYFDYSNGVPMEKSHVNPSNISYIMYEKISMIMMDIIKYFNVKRTILKLDILITNNDRIIILEGATRLSGGFDCQETTPMSTMRNPIGTMVDICVDGESNIEEYDGSIKNKIEYSKSYHGKKEYYTILMPHDKKFNSYVACAAIIADKEIKFTDKIKNKIEKYLNGEYYIIIKKDGDVVNSDNNANRIGFIFSKNKDYNKALLRAEGKANNVKRIIG